MSADRPKTSPPAGNETPDDKSRRVATDTLTEALDVLREMKKLAQKKPRGGQPLAGSRRPGGN